MLTKNVENVGFKGWGTNLSLVSKSKQKRKKELILKKIKIDKVVWGEGWNASRRGDI